MKMNAFRLNDPKFTADLWKYTVTTGVEGNDIRTFAFDRQITLTATTGSFGKMEIRLDESYDDVITLDQFYNLLGPDGNELMKNAIWQVDNIAPYINIWGHREGFKARLSFIGTDA